MRISVIARYDWEALAGCHRREPADGLGAKPAVTPVCAGEVPGLVRAPA